MQRLDISTVRKWGSTGQVRCPASINYPCPLCRILVTFSVVTVTHESNMNAVLCTAECPGCQGKVHFILFDPQPVRGPSREEDGELHMHPSFTGDRIALANLDLIPERIRRSYDEAIRVHKSGSWNATAAMCRRVLEGLLADKLGADELNGKPKLYAKIEKLASHPDLFSSLKGVFHTVREGGNFGAHFDVDADTDEDIASAMLDFVDFLVEFLYIMPKSADDLSAKLKGIDSRSEPATTGT